MCPPSWMCIWWWTTTARTSPCGQGMVCKTPQVPRALHANLRILTQSGAALVCKPDREVHPSQHTPINKTARIGDSPVPSTEQLRSQTDCIGPSPPMTSWRGSKDSVCEFLTQDRSGRDSNRPTSWGQLKTGTIQCGPAIGHKTGTVHPSHQVCKQTYP